MMWQAIEDFNGHLYLAILNENDECIWFRSKYERIHGVLINHINNIDTLLEIDSEDNPNEKYQKLIARDISGWWLVADPSEIYWDTMQHAALREFSLLKKRNK